MTLFSEITIFVLAIFVGFEVISKVPNTLHTPLMSATNAIHGIVLLGGLLLIGEVHGFLNKLLLVIAAFVGFEVISRVPNTLHTPLMSGTNAIHGIVVLGGILLIGPADGFLNDALLVVAIAFGTINVIGGFLVTDRMLAMFKGRPEPKPAMNGATRNGS